VQLEITLTGDFARFRLGDHRHIGPRLQQEPKSHENYGVIIDQQHADHALPVSGVTAIKRTPGGWRWLAWKFPPGRAMRSANPRSPKWPGRTSAAGMPMASS